jgi:hypothetical protein
MEASGRRIGRIVAAILSATLLLAGGYFLIAAARYQREFKAWETARPIDLSVDLSQPGTFAGDFHQTCSRSHGAGLGLVFPTNGVDEITLSHALNQLHLELQLLDAPGQVWFTTTIKGTDAAGPQLHDDMLSLTGVDPSIPRGHYTCTLTVVAGAPALSGRAQQLVGRYFLCGLEQLPSVISRFLGYAALIVGAGIGVLLIFLGKRRSAKAQST